MVDIRNDELGSLISEAEDATTDFKSWRVIRNPHNDDKPNRRKLAEALVGFANRDGGSLIIGVSDESREPEGEPLDEERINGIISEVAADMCEPNIQWDNTVYSHEDGDLTDGDVYVIHVERRRGAPHAITHGEGVREYRIRAGDETRPLKTEELDWLFQNQGPSDYYQHLDSALVFHKNFEPLDIELPANHSWIYNYIWKLSDKDKEFLTEDFEHMMDFSVAIAPFAFTSSLNAYHINSWDVEIRGSKSDRMPFSSGMMMQTPNVEPNMGVPMEEVGDVGITGLESSILENLSINREDLITSSDFKTPEGVDINIRVGDAAESDEYYGGSVVQIGKQEKFEFAVEFGKSRSGGAIESTLLDWHPVANLIKLGDYGRPAIDPLSDVEFSVRFITDFRFPDHIDNEYEEHVKYAQNIGDILRNDWDLNTFMDEIPSHIQYQMNYKLDMLIDAFDLK